MSPEEFKAWAGQMKRAAGHWTLDPVSLHNRQEYLFFCGRMDDPSKGIFVEMSHNKDRTVELACGQYEGAIPHIGEAMFAPTTRLQFPDMEAAIGHALGRMGLSFMLAFLQGQSPYRTVVHG